MIKYYDTDAAYEADVKSAFESQVSLIGADNTIKFDGRNVVVDIRHALTGSIAVLDGNNAMRFISVDTFSSASFMSNFTVIGIVWCGVDWPTFRGRIVIMHKEWLSLPMVKIFQWRLTGYTLDGTDRTGTLSVREASDSWAANHGYTVAYNATDAASLVSQLNTFFRANEPFVTQQWKAVLTDEGEIDLQLINWNAWQVSNNKGANGFTLTINLLPEWQYTSAMLRMNGQRSGEGTITNMPRSLDYFRKDNSSIAYNPSKDITSVKVAYPICLPGYLGTSQYQSDHCAFLRTVYGEGEQGWLKFMESFRGVRPTEYGAIGDKAKYGDARSNTYMLASKTYTDLDGNVQPLSPACFYIAGVGYDHELAAKGQWVMADADLIFDIMDGIEYPLNPDRNSDVRNRALLAIGAKAFGNSSHVRSCSRVNSSNGWIFSGNGGYANISILCNSGVAAPLLLLDVPQSAA